MVSLNWPQRKVDLGSAHKHEDAQKALDKAVKLLNGGGTLEAAREIFKALPKKIRKSGTGCEWESGMQEMDDDHHGEDVALDVTPLTLPLCNACQPHQPSNTSQGAGGGML